MGTGTPTVTTSGLSAANAILKKLKLQPFTYRSEMKNYVSIVAKPFKPANLYQEYPEETRQIMLEAYRCQYCENPQCSADTDYDIRGIMRRVSVGNFTGAAKIAARVLSDDHLQEITLVECEKQCILNKNRELPVAIQGVIHYLSTKYK